MENLTIDFISKYHSGINPKYFSSHTSTSTQLYLHPGPFRLQAHTPFPESASLLCTCTFWVYSGVLCACGGAAVLCVPMCLPAVCWPMHWWEITPARHIHTPEVWVPACGTFTASPLSEVLAVSVGEEALTPAQRMQGQRGNFWSWTRLWELRYNSLCPRG